MQVAKARFSEVFRLALTSGPQLVTRQGKDAVVILPVRQFEELIGRSKQAKSLVQFFRDSPLMGLELDLERGATSIYERFSTRHQLHFRIGQPASGTESDRLDGSGG